MLPLNGHTSGFDIDDIKLNSMVLVGPPEM